MTNKAKVDQSGFQLDKTKLLKDAPLMAKGILGGLIDYLNALDVNHDGISDVAELEPHIEKAIPLLIKIAPFIDLNALGPWLLKQEWFLHTPASESLVTELEKLGADAAAKLAVK